MQRWNHIFSDDDMSTMYESLVTLAEVAFTSKNLDVPADLKNKNIFYMCHYYFNAGTINSVILIHKTACIQ